MMDTKQVIVIRRDLGMRRGKEIAQGAHASCSWLAEKLREHWLSPLSMLTIVVACLGGIMGGALIMLGNFWMVLGVFVACAGCMASCRILGSLLGLTEEQRYWLTGKFTKVTLQVENEAALRAVWLKAVEAGLDAVLIKDSGATEFHGQETATAVAIGPHYSERIDPITRELKLY